MRRLVSPTITRTGAETTSDARRCAAVSDAIVTRGVATVTGSATGARENDASAPMISSRASSTIERAPGDAAGDRDVEAAPDEASRRGPAR